MTILNKQLLLYLVTDQKYHPELTLAEQVIDAIDGGVTCVQLREKNLNDDEIITLGKSLLNITKEKQVPLIINDSPEIAKAIGADGVHIGQSDGNIKAARKCIGQNAIIGVTAKTLEDALEAEANGADYLGVGAIYPSKTKSGAKGISIDLFKAITAAVNIPVVAIGGLTYDNIDILKESGASGIAVVSAILESNNIKDTTAKLKSYTQEVLL